MKKSLLVLTFLVLSYSSVLSQSGFALAEATKDFIKTLTKEQQKKTVYAFSDSMRFLWTNLPVGMVPRAGIQYGQLNDSSRMAFHGILSSILSSQGYLKLTSIMHLDDILNVLYQQAYDDGKINKELYQRLKDLQWAHDNYYFSIWGIPQIKEPWGINFGGHHIAFNLTITGNMVAFSPLFLGTDPAQIKTAKYAGWRVLSKEEDYGFALLGFLSESQKLKAVQNKSVPEDILTNPKSSQRITDYTGIAVTEFTSDQKAILEILLQEYIHNFEHATAHRLYDKILKTGLDKIYFAWIGSQQKGKPHYYVIHGPDFLIEYDNFQGNGNHIHLILRESGNDFGADLLKQHYLTNEHHKK
jgi:hypothetical protein